MRMTAAQVQHMTGTHDREVVAHGYTFERHTIEIYFEDNKIIRRVDGQIEWTSEMFEPNMFHQNIKRFYEQGVVPIFLALFDTFGEGLSTTPGGQTHSYDV